MRTVEQYLLIVDFNLSKAGPAYDGWQSYAGYDGWIARADEHWDRVFKSVHRVASIEDRHPSDIYAGTPRGAYISGRLETVPPRESFKFVGYDAGTYYDRYGHYSLLLHHVSRHPANWTLNAHRLFDRPEDAAALVDWWLAWAPADPQAREVVAPDDEYRPFAVFAAPTLPVVRH